MKGTGGVMSRHQRSYTVEMDEDRCFKCGRWWALEVGAGRGSCPKCKASWIDDLEQRLAKANRTIAGLKGAMNRKERVG